MPTLYRKKEDSFIYYSTLLDLIEDIQYSDYVYITHCREDKNKEGLICIDRLNISMVDVLKKVQNFETNVIIDDSTFLQDNIHQPYRKMYFFPSGSTCKNALRNHLLGINLSFLVAEDNGTKSLLPPIYFALNKLGLLRFREPYVLNYKSTSQNPTSRARLSFNILKCKVYSDYIITPGFIDGNEELYNHCKKYSKQGFVIYSKSEPILEENASTIVLLEKTKFAFYIFYNKQRPRKVLTVKKRKAHIQELLPFLRQSKT